MRALKNCIFIAISSASIVLGSGSATANSSNWTLGGYDNGAGACNGLVNSYPYGDLGSTCMMSVTGWIQIPAGGVIGSSQEQQVGCENNATASGLSWSVYNNSPVDYVAGPWYGINMISTGLGGSYPAPLAWQTGNNGSANLTMATYDQPPVVGAWGTTQYGNYGLAPTNWGGAGYWQGAIGCIAGTNYYGSVRTVPSQRVIASASSSKTAHLIPPRSSIVTLDSVDHEKGKAFLAREYSLEKGRVVKDTRECPIGMKVSGEPTWTIQEFPKDHEEPKWKDRAIVAVKHKTVGAQVTHTMRLTRAKHPTVVQFQIRCSK